MIVSCNECGGQVSDQADACVHCGCPLVAPSDETLTRTQLPRNLRIGRQIVSWLGAATLQGISDQTINARTQLGSGKAVVGLHKRGVRVQRGPARFDLHDSQVLSMEYVDCPYIMDQQKSVVGRAAIGGLVAGPVGAIVGAVSGTGTKQTSTPGFLQISFWDSRGIGPFVLAIGADPADASRFLVRWRATRAGAGRQKSSSSMLIGGAVLAAVSGVAVVGMEGAFHGPDEATMEVQEISPEVKQREALVSGLYASARSLLMQGDVAGAREALEQCAEHRGARQYGDASQLLGSIRSATEPERAVLMLSLLSEPKFEDFRAGAPLRTVRDLGFEVLNDRGDELARSVLTEALAARRERDVALGRVAVPPPEGGHRLSVEADELGDGRVRLRITTTIPGTVEVMAGLALAGQAPEDIFVGTNERVQLVEGKGEVVVDASELPAGRYDAEASFYPRWGLADQRAKKSGATHELEATHAITLTGSGEAAAVVVERNANRAWVMENVYVGMPWKTEDWTRFGDAELVALTGNNPKVVKGLYFPSLDMTVLVNVLKGEIVTWRDGRATK